MLQEHILGALYGQSLGDAMGMPSELWPRSKVKSYFSWIDHFIDGPAENNAACYFKAAQFTDDTAIALALADAIIVCDGKINPTVIAQHILQWALSFDAFNKNILGPSSKAALYAISQGASVDSLANNGLTNGAAMRASVLGCLLPVQNFQDFFQQVWLASSPTHKSDIAVAGAVVIAWAVSQAISGYSWDYIVNQLPGIAQRAQTQIVTSFSPSLSARMDLALNIVSKNSHADDASEQIYQLIGAGTSTVESVASAIAMVALSNTDPKACAILCANLGGDTDTIGAMAVSICGALHGSSAIDLSLKAQLDQANEVDFTYYANYLAQYRSAYVSS